MSSNVIEQPPAGQIFIDPVILEKMKVLVTGQTDEALNDRFGISYNTWRKLVAGRPVRRSLAERVTHRVVAMSYASSLPD